MDCSFCGKAIEPGTESVYVTNKGKPFYFCSSKCEKSLLKLGRKPRKSKWTKEYRIEKDIRLRGLTPAAPKPKEEKEEKKAAAPKPLPEKPKTSEAPAGKEKPKPAKPKKLPAAKTKEKVKKPSAEDKK